MARYAIEIFQVNFSEIIQLQVFCCIFYTTQYIYSNYNGWIGILTNIFIIYNIQYIYPSSYKENVTDVELGVNISSKFSINTATFKIYFVQVIIQIKNLFFKTNHEIHIK